MKTLLVIVLVAAALLLPLMGQVSPAAAYDCSWYILRAQQLGQTPDAIRAQVQADVSLLAQMRVQTQWGGPVESPAGPEGNQPARIIRVFRPDPQRVGFPAGDWVEVFEDAPRWQADPMDAVCAMSAANVLENGYQTGRRMNTGLPEPVQKQADYFLGDPRQPEIDLRLPGALLNQVNGLTNVGDPRSNPYNTGALH